MEKLVFLIFRGYLGEIESEKKKLGIVHTLSSFEWAMLYQGQYLKFKVLTRKSGGGRAFGNIVRF